MFSPSSSKVFRQLSDRVQIALTVAYAVLAIVGMLALTYLHEPTYIVILLVGPVGSLTLTSIGLFRQINSVPSLTDVGIFLKDVDPAWFDIETSG